MHSPKLLHRVCSGTKQASVGPDCVSNLGVNSGEREHTAGMKLSVRICVSLVRHTHTLSPQWQLDPETVMAERTWSTSVSGQQAPHATRSLSVLPYFLVPSCPIIFFLFLALYHLPQTSVPAQDSLYIWISCHCSLHTKWSFNMAAIRFHIVPTHLWARPKFISPLLTVKTNKQRTHMSIGVSWSQDVSIIEIIDMEV